MPSNFPLHAGQPVLPFLLVWLVTIAAMFILFRFVNRWTRQKLPWLQSARNAGEYPADIRNTRPHAGP